MRKLLLLPTLILPYMVVLESLIPELPLKINLFILFFVFIAAVICNIVFVATSNESPKQLVIYALVIKLAQIPAYILIFVVGLFSLAMAFMLAPVFIALVIFDVFSLLVNGIVSVYAVVRSLENTDGLSKSRIIITAVCQYVFCIDVIMLLLFRIRIKQIDY